MVGLLGLQPAAAGLDDRRDMRHHHQNSHQNSLAFRQPLRPDVNYPMASAVVRCPSASGSVLQLQYQPLRHSLSTGHDVHTYAGGNDCSEYLTPGSGHIDQDILFLLEDTEKGIAQLETDLVDLPACSSREESFPDRVALLVLWVDKVCLESQPGSDGWLRGRAALTRLHSLSDSYASVVLAKPGVITKKSRLPSF